MSAQAITHLLHVYGYAAVFAVVAGQALGAPLPGTTALVAAALYAATTHELSIAWILVAGAGGALAGTSAGYALGRWRGEAVLLRLARWLRQDPVRVQRLRQEFAERGHVWLFAGRFISGVRNVTGLLAGSSGMPVCRFLVVSAAAAAAWAAFNGLEYYFFGRAIAGAATWVQIVLVALGLAWLAVSLNLLRRRALRALGTSPDGPRSPL